jgi:hypothetical protein
VILASKLGTHTWEVGFEMKVIRAEGAFRACLIFKDQGFQSDEIIAHSNWGESLFKGLAASEA